MISISHLRKKFGNLLAVDDLCLEVHAGEILGFLGPNGAGKTTSIRMICGLLKPDGGEILWGNQAEALRSQIGYCPQENIYWPEETPAWTSAACILAADANNRLTSGADLFLKQQFKS